MQGPLVNIPIPSAPSNAHVRTLRKGSSDHLAINIDSESDRLINKVDKDEDKGVILLRSLLSFHNFFFKSSLHWISSITGHAFKSLNTSGLVPRQGRILADRIDGIWYMLLPATTLYLLLLHFQSNESNADHDQLPFISH